MDVDYLREMETIKATNTNFGEIELNLKDDPQFRFRRSIIFATLAESDITTVDIQRLLEAGMNIARFQTSHSTKSDKIKLMTKIDEASLFLGEKHGVKEWPCSTCIELKTSNIQTGILAMNGKSLEIVENTEIILTYDLEKYDKCNEHIIFVDNPYLTSDAKIGMEITISQETIVLECVDIMDDKSIKCNVIKSGSLSNLASVCMRGVNRTRPPLTNKDMEIIKFALEYELDIIALNYVLRGETLRKLKKIIGQNVVRPLILSGICTHTDIENIDEIIEESDGIIISREYLAYELNKSMANKIFCIQKYISGKCREAGKPYFISGDVFRETLRYGTLIDREIADVTNALLDGASGFVLRDYDDLDYLVLVIKFINNLCTSVEPYCFPLINFQRQLSQKRLPVNAAAGAAISCAMLANCIGARLIIIPTVSGRTVSFVSCLKSTSVIIAVTSKRRTHRLLRSLRSVYPMLYEDSPKECWSDTVRSRVNYALSYAVDNRWIGLGDSYVTLEKASEESPFCDCVRYWHVSITKRTMIECPASQMF